MKLNLILYSLVFLCSFILAEKPPKAEVLHTLYHSSGTGSAHISFSLDSKTLAVAGRNVSGTWYWNMQTGQNNKARRRHATYLQYSGKHLILGEHRGRVLAWNLEENEEDGSYQKNRFGRAITGIASNDGNLIAYCNENEVSVWNRDKGEHSSFRVTRGYPTGALAITKDNKTVVYGSGLHGVTLYDIATKKNTGNLMHPQRGSIGIPRVSAIAISADGKTMATGDGRGLICVWDLTQKKVIQELYKHKPGNLSLAFSPDGKFLISGSTAEKKAILWNVTNKKSRTLKFPKQRMGKPISAAYSADGAMVAVGTNSGYAAVWKLAAKRSPQDVKKDMLNEIKKICSQAGWKVQVKEDKANSVTLQIDKE